VRGRIAARVGLVLLVLFAAFPFYWAVVASFTREATLFREPSLWPRELILDHYRALFTERDFWTPIKNSLIVALTTTVFCVTIGAFAAYALARIEFRGKRAVLAFILAVTMFPQISIVSPLYLLLRELRLINTYPGLILPYLTFAMPLTVWLLVGFFRQLPSELEEAAMVDGAGRLRALREVILPLALPGLAATAILTFVYSWNEFLFGLILSTRNAVPVTVGATFFITSWGVKWGATAAAMMLSVLPPLLLGLVSYRYLGRAMLAGAVKG